MLADVYKHNLIVKCYQKIQTLPGKPHMMLVACRSRHSDVLICVRCKSPPAVVRGRMLAAILQK